MRHCFTLLLLGLSFILPAQNSIRVNMPFLQDDRTSASYPEVIRLYEQLDSLHEALAVRTYGDTDAGFPLHLAILSIDGDFDPVSLRKKGKRILFINNAIHPGEPCGVDATMMLLQDYLLDPARREALENVVVIAIPFYNIGGGLNRGSFSRANQEGPIEYGFRGNARNLDLNRDFIKCDSRNARTFNQIFQEWQPDVFVDNHTSNGADYQYTMTLIASHPAKLAPPLAGYLNDRLLPDLYQGMAKRGWEMTPYVNVDGTPDEGIYGFLDLPRYSTGYAALHQCIGFTPETHMLKPYRDRVWGAYHLMDELIQIIARDADQIGRVRTEAREGVRRQSAFDLNWELDREKADTLLFKGYEAAYRPSEVSGKDRLYYDRSRPFTRKIPYFNNYRATLSVQKPFAYLLPQAYAEVAERLRWNGVELHRLEEDVTLEVEQYYIESYETSRGPYEGHYLHYQVELRPVVREWTYRKGDYLIYADQTANAYLVSVLEPQAPDSYFAWNFFDGILMQKEYFSSYVFEDIAADLLRQDPALRRELEARKAADPQFAENARAQLDFVYKRSPYYEPTHDLYPVGRILEPVRLGK